MDFTITKKDIEDLEQGEAINLHTKDSKGYHWTPNIAQMEAE